MGPKKKQKGTKGQAIAQLSPEEEEARKERLKLYGVSDSLAEADNGLSEAQQREWLERSKEWPNIVQGMGRHRYLPQKVLGGGEYGTVGLWALQPRDEDENDGGNEDGDVFPNLAKKKREIASKRRMRLTAATAAKAAADDSPPPSYLVIKQEVANVEARLQMHWESKLLRQIMGTGTDHVVKIYKGFHLDGGSGTHATRDPVPFSDRQTYDVQKEISRIYLEYCAGGSMNDYITWWDNNGDTVSEEHIWRIMLCIFKGLLILERGQEDPADPPAKLTEAWGQPIAHFDIKPDNNHDIHERLETFKLADFGSAMKVPVDPAEVAAENWINEAWWRKTADYAPPEQYFDGHNERNNITTKTGVWSAVAVLYRLCCGSLLEQNDTFSGEWNTMTSGDPEKLLSPEIFPYSKELIRAFCDCLAENPSDRPEISKMVRRVQRVVDAYDTVQRDVPDNPLYTLTGPNVLFPGSSGTQLLVNRIARTIKAKKGEPKYNSGQEPQPDESPERGPPFFFFGTHRIEGFPPVTLAEYPYQPLYNVPVRRAKSKAKANNDAAPAPPPSPRRLRPRVA